MDIERTKFPNLFLELENKRVLVIDEVTLTIPLIGFEKAFVFDSTCRRLIYMGIYKDELQNENHIFGWDNQLFRAIVSSGDLTDFELLGHSKWQLYHTEFKLHGKPASSVITSNFVSEGLDRVYEKSKGHEVPRTLEYLKCLPINELSVIHMKYLFGEYT